MISMCFVASCSKDAPSTPTDPTVDSGAITFTESISTMATKATDTAFEAGDEISVTAYDVTGALYASNASYIYDSGLFSSENPIIYGEGDAASLSFRAVYPYTELSEYKSVSFNILADQSVDGNYTLSDLMYSYVESTDAPSPKLTFNHILTKVVFNLTSVDINMVDVVATINTPTAVDYDLATLSATITNSSSAVTMASNGSNSYKAIVAPQTCAAGSTLGYVTVDGVDYELVIDSEITFAAGVQYTYALTLFSGKLTFDDPLIEDWDNGGTVDDTTAGDGTEGTEDPEEDDPEAGEDVTVGDDYETSQIYVSSLSEFNAIDLDKLAEGEVVVWRDGTYNTLVVEIEGDGSSTKPIRVRAETPGGVIFTGSSRMVLDGSYIEVSGFWWKDPTQSNSTHVVRFDNDSRYCKVSNCAISGYNAAEDTSNESKWVSMYGRFNTLDSCTIVDKKNEGCMVVVWFDDHDVAPTHIITNNYFERPNTIYESGSAINGQETIRIGTSDYSMSDGGCLVENNHFYTCHGEQGECISNKSGDNTYRNNLFENTQSSLTLRHGNGCLVEYNYVEGGGESSTGGIRIIGEDHIVRYNYLSNVSATGYRAGITLVKGVPDSALNDYFQVINAQVYENVLVDCKYAIQVNYGTNSTQTLGAIETTIRDNIVYTSSSSNRFVSYNTASGGDDITWSNNEFYGSGVFYNITSLSTTGSSKPAAADYPTEAMQAIRDGAGCSWTIN